MAVVNSVVFQIAGFQNSGKTTFMNKLLGLLKERGLRVAALKHHGHGGKPCVAEEKDSARHISSGAVASLVEGGGRVLIQAEKSEWSFEEKLALLSPFQSDIILIEGHKYEEFPKAVLVRTCEELKKLSALTNIQAIYYWDADVPKELTEKDFPAFHIDDRKGLEWLVDYLEKKVREENNDRC